jgi:hypothetical protein
VAETGTGNFGGLVAETGTENSWFSLAEAGTGFGIFRHWENVSF